jgi:hypothetical protein
MMTGDPVFLPLAIQKIVMACTDGANRGEHWVSFQHHSKSS